jgi:hypothetical protein
MFGFVNSYLAATGKGYVSKLSPTLFTYIRDHDVLRFEIFHGRLKVVAHEKKFVLVVLLGIMESDFQWRHGENQPTVAGIHAGKLEHIAEKSPVGFRILGVNDDMRSIDHVYSCLDLARYIFPL